MGWGGGSPLSIPYCCDIPAAILNLIYPLLSWRSTSLLLVHFSKCLFPAYCSTCFFFPQALHKISLRETVCTRRVCDAILSILFTLIDFGVLADRNKRRRQEDEDKKA